MSGGPNLIIANGGGQWTMSIANTTVSYDLVGANAAEQAATARELAQTMTEGMGEVISYMRNFLEDVGNNAMTYTELFKNTGGLMLNEQLLISADGADLSSVIVEAGEALLEALG